MTNNLVRLLIVTAFYSLSYTGFIAAAEPLIPGLIVKMLPGVKHLQLDAQRVDQMSVLAGQTLSFARPMSGDAAVITFSEKMTVADAEILAAQLSQQSDVEYASPDYIRYPSATPNDARYSEQWYLPSVSSQPGSANLEDAWDITTGSASNVIAVVDTGILPHVDIDNVLPGYDFISTISVANDGDGRDADPTDPGDAADANECGNSQAYPSTWHGTFVAGIISATTNNAVGIAGIDQQAAILPLRVLGVCGGFDSDILDATRWAAGISVPGVPDNTNPAAIANLSLGGQGSCTDAQQAMVDDVVDSGTILVFAAGNEGQKVKNVSPASCNGGITVAATTIQGAETVYTNFGDGIDIAAPGGQTSGAGPGITDADGILSTSDSGADTADNDDSYELSAGTSFAAPIVSGIASLMLAVDPDLTPSEVELTMRVRAREFPTGTSDGYRDCEFKNCGAGIVNALAAVTAVRDGELAGTYADGSKLEALGDINSSGSSLALWSLFCLLLGVCLKGKIHLRSKSR